MAIKKYEVNGEGAARLYSFVSEIEKKSEDNRWSVVGRWTVPIITDVLYSPYDEAVRINYQRKNESFESATLDLFEGERTEPSRSISELQVITDAGITEVQPPLDISLIGEAGL